MSLRGFFWLAALETAFLSTSSDELLAQPVTMSCASKPGERQHCGADTSKGVVLARSSGEAPCLLGKSWGYDDDGVWVADGCSGEFVVGGTLPEAPQKEEPEKKGPAYIPNAGFRLI